MRTIKLLFVFSLCSFHRASGSTISLCDQTPGNLVANCGFETGNFSDWTLSGNTADPGGFYYGVDARDAYSGNFGAYLGPLGAPLYLSQNLDTQTGAEYFISFELDQDTPPTVGYIHSFSFSFGGLELISLLNPVSSGWVNYSFLETANSSVSPLEFAFRDDDNYWSFDDVEVTQVPEPSGMLLMSSAFVILLWLRHPRRGRPPLVRQSP